MADELDPIARRALNTCRWMNSQDKHFYGSPHVLGLASNIFAYLCPDQDERRAILARQQAKGVAKYGKTLSEATHTPEEWHAHACEEAADLLVYLIAEEEARKQPAAATPDSEGENT